MALSCVLLAACGGDEPAAVETPRPAPTPTAVSPSPSPTPTTPSPSPTRASDIDKILVMVIENKSYGQMKSSAPKIWALAQKYAYATDFTAIRHPSLPNYIAMAAGSTLGVSSNGFPSKIKLRSPSVFGNTIKAGGTAEIMADGMGAENCKTTEIDQYVPRHVPWLYFVDERELCQEFVTDAADFDVDVAAGGLSNVGMLIPDNCHNAHDCSIPTADDWIAAQVEVAMSGPDWKSGRLAIVITADEDNKKAGNRILTVVLHPSQKSRVVTTPLTLYSLHRLLADVGKTEPMNKGRAAPDMAKAFGLPLA